MNHINAFKTLLFAVGMLVSLSVFGQTNATIFGLVEDDKGEALPGATIIARHESSGSIFGTTSREDGRFNLPNVRIGGPYTITCSFTGFENKVENDVFLSLGQSFRLNFKLGESKTMLSEVVVLAETNATLNGSKTGASSNIKGEALTTLPSLSRSLNDFLRLTPQSRSSSVASTAGSGISFGGQDSRFNNLTIDGSIFNNSFGLAGAPGGQTNSTPISLDAIDEIQVNLAPFDVRLGGFTGAGVNAVTKSGDNKTKGTLFFNTRNQDFTGKKAGKANVVRNDFDIKQFGASIGGAIKKDKLFYFVNFESEQRTDPATAFVAFRDTVSTPIKNSNVSRVKASELDDLSAFLIDKYDYDPGRYEGYSLATASYKGLLKLDYNINKTHRASFRYNQLRSKRDVLSSNSGVVSGNRNGNQDAINFENTNYVINNDLYSAILELNSVFGSRISNQFQVGYTANRDYRSSKGGIFPLVDIQSGNKTLTSFGFEPFTPNNRLNTNTFQIKDDVSVYMGKHTLTAGVNFESFRFENTFTPRYYGHYTFGSIADFKAATNGDSVGLKRYFQTYSALDGGALPVAVTKAMMPGVYLQDEFDLFKNFKLTAGVRVDVPIFGKTALNNPRVDTMTFYNWDFGRSTNFQTKTSALPEPQFMISPRIGFNYDVLGNRSLQMRGGTGIFTGRPAFVWISNQIGNNGILTGETNLNNTNTVKYPFSPDVTKNIPANPTLPATFATNFTDKNFKFPQVWRTNLAVDYKLPLGFVATVEGIYSSNINDILYVNANLEAPSGNFTGADARPYFPGYTASATVSGAKDKANRKNDAITNAILLKNSKGGSYYSATFQVERPVKKGWGLKAAYNFAQAKDYMTSGSIAASSWADNKTTRGNNDHDLSFSENDQRHRVIIGGSYKIKEGKHTATTISIFLQSGNQGRASLVYNGDINGDQTNNNDLFFVPAAATDLSFKTLQTIFSNTDGTKDTVRVLGAQQATALQSLIDGDEYLTSRKGKYTDRNGLLLGWLTTVDMTISQDVYFKVKGKTQGFQIRADFSNVGNMLNAAWGVRDVISSNNFVVATGVSDAAGKPVQQFGTIGVDRKYTAPTTIRAKGATLSDVWQAQIGLRYSF
jgi:Carboxypeptidase regulatory-like domain/TonB-dependent Receptor Plug Domain